MGYDPAWAGRYAYLAGLLARELGPGWEIEHVGSTSVPGLLAKPVIDLALRLPSGENPADWAEVFHRLGWDGPAELGTHQAYVQHEGDIRVAIAHVFTAHAWPHAHVRLFAEWLRALQQPFRQFDIRPQFPRSSATGQPPYLPGSASPRRGGR